MATARLTRPILIAGGGIGGLAAALALAQRGFKCRVLERKPHFSEAGAGIQIGPNGVAILRALGLASSLQAKVGVPQEIRVFEAKRARLLTSLPLGDAIEQKLGAPYWTAHRADLHAALLDQAQRNPNIVVQTGFEADRLEATSDGVRLFSLGGENVSGAALIGADGLWSKVRRYVTDGIDLRFTGRRAYRTVVATTNAPPAFQNNSVGLWLSPGAHVVHYPVRGGVDTAVVVILAGQASGEDWSNHADGAALLASAGQLAPELRTFLAVADTWNSWGLYDTGPLTRWTNGRVALLGDAAHPTLPFLAQGGVLALEDAVTLAAKLEQSGGDIPAAFATYAKARIPRTTRVAATARRNGAIYHMRGLSALTRNWVMRAAPPLRLIGQYDWLYGWKPSA